MMFASFLRQTNLIMLHYAAIAFIAIVLAINKIDARTIDLRIPDVRPTHVSISLASHCEQL